VRVGVNYPWFDYGWDFGPAPPGWRGTRTTPFWYDALDGQLQRFGTLGISVVRWFILADGMAYGSGAAAPIEDPANAGVWHFDPPPLDTDLLVHFNELLTRFDAFNVTATAPIQLLPVFIDFNFCNPGLPAMTDWVKQGRAEAVTDAAKCARVLDAALDPLLRVSQGHPEAIYAWEVINEPEWITNGWHPDGRTNHPIDDASMRAFLDQGKQRIRQAGFKPTIGFALRDTLLRTGITSEINQFHYYPNGQRRLDPHTFDPEFPGIIGEFATSETDRWPDLQTTNQSVLARLKLIASLGYPLALPWSYLARDRHTTWSANVEHDLEVFHAEQSLDT
jgi:hypothetical protein